MIDKEHRKNIERLLEALEPWLLSIAQQLSSGSVAHHRKQAAEAIADIIEGRKDG